jgi:hypothetical protein
MKVPVGKLLVELMSVVFPNLSIAYAGFEHAAGARKRIRPKHFIKRKRPPAGWTRLGKRESEEDESEEDEGEQQDEDSSDSADTRETGSSKSGSEPD